MLSYCCTRYSLSRPGGASRSSAVISPAAPAPAAVFALAASAAAVAVVLWWRRSRLGDTSRREHRLSFDKEDASLGGAAAVDTNPHC